jgi:hypothetical protein
MAGPNGDYFGMPISLNFTATGGNGTYTWSDTQLVNQSGFVSYSNGIVEDLSIYPSFYESLTNTAKPRTGSVANFYDAPGEPYKAHGGTVVLADIVLNFWLFVAVTSGDQTVECPIIAWQATQTWATIKGKLVITGQDTVLLVGGVPPQ